jgi:hypothetical protein
MFTDLEQIQSLRNAAKDHIKTIKGIRVDRNALPEEELDKQPDYHPIRKPIYDAKDVTWENTHLVSQNARNSKDKSEAFLAFRNGSLDHIIPPDLPKPSHTFNASDLYKYTGLTLKEANKVFKGSFGKENDYYDFQRLIDGAKDNGINDKFAVQWGNWHEPNALERVRAAFNIRICQIGRKSTCISKELGLYISANPDFLFEFPEIEGLMGTGEAKSRSPIIEFDHPKSFVLQLKKESCIPYDPMKYLHVGQANTQAAMFSMLYFMYTSWTEENGSKAYLYEFSKELFDLQNELLLFFFQKFIQKKTPFDWRAMEDPFKEIRQKHNQYIGLVDTVSRAYIAKWTIGDLEMPLVSRTNQEKREREMDIERATKRK